MQWHTFLSLLNIHRSSDIQITTQVELIIPLCTSFIRFALKTVLFCGFPSIVDQNHPSFSAKDEVKQVIFLTHGVCFTSSPRASSWMTV